MTTNAPFVRDRFTWLAYLMLSYFAYLQAAPGPLMPFLRDELHLSYTVGGLHFSAMAFGMVLSGLVSDRVARRWGRQRVFWAGGGGMAVGALFMALGHHPVLTIFGAWVMGFLGTFLLAAVQASLADRHGEQRAYALTESNIAASACAGLAPLLVGVFQRGGVGWRSALYVAVIVWGVALLRFRTERIPVARSAENTPSYTARHALPSLFWVYWIVLALCVAVEWSVVAWGADFLVDVGGLRKADASLVMTLFFVAMVIGRATGSRLTRLMDTSRLMLLALSIALGGFVVFWLVPVVGVRVAGLFVAGLGVANLFPFMLSTAVGIGAEQADLASARLTLGAGLSILTAPQALGWTADQTSIRTAYGIVFVLLLVAMGATAFANRLVTRQNGARIRPQPIR